MCYIYMCTDLFRLDFEVQQNATSSSLSGTSSKMRMDITMDVLAWLTLLHGMLLLEGWLNLLNLLREEVNFSLEEFFCILYILT